jgi:uncharacterized 2Fe-2S/4Fe-4S cluster protein (DUF4445 family)
MATVPFVPVTTSPVSVRGSELGLRVSPLARLSTLPSSSAYVGGDIVAGLVAVGFGGLNEETVFIDIGTNGEVVVGSGEGAVCAALEGGELRYEVAGDAAPAGLCGTGLVDVVACLLDVGVIDETGRIDAESKSSLAGSVREGADGVEFVLWTGGGGEVVLTQRDVRELQLAKGAICAGARVLLDELGVAPGGVRGVLLAGAFGSTMDPRSAIRIGLLPGGVERSRVRAVGNTAAAGARAALASRSARREAARIARWLRPVELSLHGRFQELFAESMLFPARGE